MKGRRFSLILAAACLLLLPLRVLSQARPAASGPGSFVAAGAGVSLFQADYGRQRLGGGFVFVDLHPHWRVGFEAEARFLRWHAAEELTESTYLGGVRVLLWPRTRRLLPYAKFLAGAGEIQLPYGYAHGGFLALVPGAGLDVALSDRISVRAVDLEYQRWPDFPYGALQPYGLSAGISYRINAVPHFPRGARARH